MDESFLIAAVPMAGVATPAGGAVELRKPGGAALLLRILWVVFSAVALIGGIAISAMIGFG